MAMVYLGIGSNQGDRRYYITEAISCLNKNGVSVLKVSSIIETDPVGGPPGQGKFLNAAVEARTELSPEELLVCVKSIERQLGRTETVRNGPRPIDLDVLLYDRLTIRNPQLTIPHPRMREREFVMRPLKEIAPRIVEGLSHAYRQEN
jgi:2-amino-4-hydroxy-6-hydroxymethyldihydropteridine diphosphokinase